MEEELVFWHNADRALFELFEQGMEWAGKKGEWNTLCAHALPRPFAAFGCAALTSAVCLRPTHARAATTAHTGQAPVLLGAPLCSWPLAICSSLSPAPSHPPTPRLRLRLTSRHVREGRCLSLIHI